MKIDDPKTPYHDDDSEEDKEMTQEYENPDDQIDLEVKEHLKLANDNR